MKLIGLTGAIGHGKTSFAAALDTIEPKSRHFESGQVISELANNWKQAVRKMPDVDNLADINQAIAALPDIIRRLLNVNCRHDQLSITEQERVNNPALTDKLLLYLRIARQRSNYWDEEITLDNKNDHRALLQWLGGYLPAKVNPGIWYDELIWRTERAKEQGARLCTVSGLRYPADAQIVRQARGLIVQVVRPTLQETDLQDPTEQSRHSIRADSIVYNDAGLGELRICASIFYHDLLAGQLKAKYLASAAARS